MPVQNRVCPCKLALGLCYTSLFRMKEEEQTMEWNELYDAGRKPDMEQIGAYVANGLWEELCRYLELEYKTAPRIEYSRCSMQPGWNVKYKKGGRALCTLYPAEGHYTCMVSIGSREAAEAELLLTACTPYVRELYRDAGCLNGSRWLMIDVTDRDILADVMELIQTRVQKKAG